MRNINPEMSELIGEMKNFTGMMQVVGLQHGSLQPKSRHVVCKTNES